MALQSDFFPFYVTVDVVVLTLREDVLHVLLVERGSKPYLGELALPGGFVQPTEDLEPAALRELREETGISLRPRYLEQLSSYGAPDRDPRHRTISIAYLAVLPRLPEPTAGTDARAAGWYSLEEVADRALAFDHRDILEDGLERARAKLEYTSLATAFCDPEFTVAQLRRVYEAVWGRPLDPGNFHRKVLASPGFVEPTGRVRSGGRGRPSQLYRAGEAAVLHPPVLR
ncbi:NUDIX hydrolase [Auraticoccus cholistanensis]|uniref:NUDIX hydrolase n=1 Tax=Auraticoccus cholistanensis TaxID=2656650 RepID=UPI002F915078